jgi:hypothetical protein
MADTLSNLAPAIIGLAAAAVGLIYARQLRLGAKRDRKRRVEAPDPAE